MAQCAILAQHNRKTTIRLLREIYGKILARIHRLRKGRNRFAKKPCMAVPEFLRHVEIRLLYEIRGHQKRLQRIKRIVLATDPEERTLDIGKIHRGIPENRIPLSLLTLDKPGLPTRRMREEPASVNGVRPAETVVDGR